MGLAKVRRVAGLAALGLAAAGPVHAAWSAADSHALVARLFAAFNRHDAAAMAALYAPDVTLTSSAFCGVRRGREAARQTYQALFDQAPGVVDEVEAVVAEGDAVAVRFVGRAPVDGVPREVARVTAFLRMRDGLVTEVDTVQDSPAAACGGASGPA